MAQVRALVSNNSECNLDTETVGTVDHYKRVSIFALRGHC